MSKNTYIRQPFTAVPTEDNIIKAPAPSDGKPIVVASAESTAVQAEHVNDILPVKYKPRGFSNNTSEQSNGFHADPQASPTSKPVSVHKSAKDFENALHRAGFKGELNQAITRASKALHENMVSFVDENENGHIDKGELFIINPLALEKLNSKLASKGKKTFDL